jgi:hypothetical protein
MDVNLKPEPEATGVTRVREWRSGVRAEALEIRGREGLTGKLPQTQRRRVRQNRVLPHRPQGARNSGITDHRPRAGASRRCSRVIHHWPKRPLRG